MEWGSAFAEFLWRDIEAGLTPGQREQIASGEWGPCDDNVRGCLEHTPLPLTMLTVCASPLQRVITRNHSRGR